MSEEKGPIGVIRVLGFAGSLRRHSYNRGLLRAAEELAPEGIRIEAFDLTPIPLYNADVEAQGDPEPVRLFKERIRAAGALLIASPEHNYSVSGVLKNAIDWASRPPRDSVLRGKPVAIIGATPGGFGTIRAQDSLRTSFRFTESYVMLKPELMVSQARDKFDAEGNLTDPKTREQLRAVLEGLIAWTQRFGP